MEERDVGECMSYVYDERGRTNAVGSEHDDLVMAVAIGVRMAEQPGVLRVAVPGVERVGRKRVAKLGGVWA